MKASKFLLETSGIPAVIFSKGVRSPANNRLFELRQGESLKLRSMLAGDDFLYLMQGKVCIVAEAKPQHQVTLQEREQAAPKAYPMPAEGWVEVVAEADALLYQVDSKRMDDVITWTGIAQSLQQEPEKLEILAKVLTTRSLTNLPVESVFELITRMQISQVQQGYEVVTQGGQAEHFYILQQGEAEVWAMGLYDEKPRLVNVLRAGDSFGEDALVTGGTRNATVRMKTDGVLLIGNQADFSELIANPCIEEVDSEMAHVMKDKEGYQLLDVRYEEEYEDSHIESCKLIPLHELRERLGELDSETRYITYCRSGKRSAVAALIMKRSKLNVVSMRGGMNQWPYKTKSLY